MLQKVIESFMRMSFEWRITLRNSLGSRSPSAAVLLHFVDVETVAANAFV
jgi:hypothetical protein